MKILRGTIVGGVAFFFLGWLIYGILLMDFYSSGVNQCMNRAETDMVWWAIIASNFVIALLLTLILNWSGAKGVVDAFKTGAIFGLLHSISMGLSFWSMTTMYNSMSIMVVEIIVSAIFMGVVSMLIVLLWGKNKEA